MKNLPGIRKPMTTTPRWLVTLVLSKFVSLLSNHLGFTGSEAQSAGNFLWKVTVNLLPWLLPLKFVPHLVADANY